MKFDNWLETVNDSVHERAYKEYHQPWAQYVVNISGFQDFHSPPNNVPEMWLWCKNNLTGEYDLDFYGYFEIEEDSVLFALRWA